MQTRNRHWQYRGHRKKPMPREHAYTSAKAAILTFTKTVAAEYAAKGASFGRSRPPHSP